MAQIPVLYNITSCYGNQIQPNVYSFTKGFVYFCSVYFSHQGNRTNIGGIRERDEVASDIPNDSSLSSSFPTNHKGAPWGSTDSPSPYNSFTSLCEDADSGIFWL